MLGNDLGALPLVVAVAVAFGVGAIVAGSVLLFTVIKMHGSRIPHLPRSAGD